MSNLETLQRTTWKAVLAGALLTLITGSLGAQLPGAGRNNFKPPPRPKGPTPTFKPKIPWRYNQPDTAPFRKLDTVVGPFVNLNVVPFSPIAITPNGNFVGIVNTHANLVRIFDSSDPNPANWQMIASLRTAWGPVSCGFFDNPGCVPEILVTCSNSDSLVWMNYTGRIEGLLGLPGEPSDLLVDHARSTAWVSCMGADRVVEIDLLTKRVRAEYPIPSKHPAFLAFESGNTGTVIVSPMLSGNNTTVDRGGPIFNVGPKGIIDLSTATQGLPDEDLFRLDPIAGTVEPVVIGAGTILFDHGKNPTTGEWWMLGTDAKNAQLQSEPKAQSIFSENRLTIINALPPIGQAPAIATRFLNLDDSDPILPGVQINPAITIGQPYALEFDSSGNGFITGMLTDNVTQYNSAGQWVQEWNVGSIPRGLKLIAKGANEYLAVYCWGSNRIEIYLPAVGTGLVATLDAGPDPTHPMVRAGRTLYYTASHSRDNNMSCNTCHIDGFSDMLAWDLSDRRKDALGNYSIAVDDKGPLITQTLRSIKGQNPYHWRGERGDLDVFNGAFPGLLGGTPLDTTPGGDFDKFQTFVMSLHERANPFESVRRIITDRLVPDSFPAGTSAVRGQDLFYDKNSLPSFSCQDCHTLPSGTRNATFRDELTASGPQKSHYVVAPLLSFWRKLQPTKVSVEYGVGEMDVLPTLGVGLSATGLADDLQDFVLQAAFLFDQQEKDDVAAFLMQLDTGIPPLMHKGVRVGFGTDCVSPLVIGPTPNPYSASTRATGASAVGTGSAPPPIYASVQPGIAPGIADEETANTVAINLLVEKSKPDALQLVLVAELVGQPLTGVYDPDNAVFDLDDGTATTVNLTSTQLLQAFKQGTLVGMIFPMPNAMGDLYTELDPDDGTPAVIPGPGPVVIAPPDPGDEGNGGGGSNPSSVTARNESGDGFTTGASVAIPTAALPMHASHGAPTIRNFEVIYATSRVAKLVFYTDVPTITMTEYTPEFGFTRQHFEPMYAKAHMVFLRDLDPSETWDLRIVATDEGLDWTELIIEDAFSSMNALIPTHVVARRLSARTPAQDSGGTLRFTVDISVERINENLAVNFTSLFDVLVHDSVADAWREELLAISAPPTDAFGDSFIEISVSGLSPGDEVLVRLNDILDPSTTNYVWSLPDTPSGNRKLSVNYTGTGP